MSFTKRLGLKVGGDILDQDGKIIESKEDRVARMNFERSHPFEVGHRVLLTKTHTPNMKVYQSIIGIVSRVKTTPSTGCCITIDFGGVNINIWEPNKDLIPATKLGSLIYR